MGTEGLDPSNFKIVGTELSPGGDRSNKTANKGTPMAAMAIAIPVNAIEESLRLKGSSGSLSNKSVFPADPEGSSPYLDGEEAEAGSGSIQEALRTAH